MPLKLSEYLHRPHRGYYNIGPIGPISALKATHPSPSVYLQKMTATGDLWEVRLIFAGNIFRLLGWMEGSNKRVWAHGFTKKTQKTPPQEILHAEI